MTSTLPSVWISLWPNLKVVCKPSRGYSFLLLEFILLSIISLLKEEIWHSALVTIHHRFIRVTMIGNRQQRHLNQSVVGLEIESLFQWNQWNLWSGMTLCMCVCVCACVCVFVYVKGGNEKCFSDYREKLVPLPTHFRVFHHIMCGLLPWSGELFVVCTCLGVTKNSVMYESKARQGNNDIHVTGMFKIKTTLVGSYFCCKFLKFSHCVRVKVYLFEREGRARAWSLWCVYEG